MPLYEYQCTACGAVAEMFRPIAQRNDPAFCAKCEGSMQKIFSTPTLFTETAFFGRRGSDDGFGHDNRSRIIARAKARRAGVSTEGKVFMPQLCRKGKPFDPQAWVGDVSDIKRAAAAANVNVKGSIVNIKQPKMAVEMRPYRVADDIVDRKVQDAIADNYGGKVDDKTYRTLKESVRDAITPKNTAMVPHEVLA